MRKTKKIVEEMKGGGVEGQEQRKYRNKNEMKQGIGR